MKLFTIACCEGVRNYYEHPSAGCRAPCPPLCVGMSSKFMPTQSRGHGTQKKMSDSGLSVIHRQDVAVGLVAQVGEYRRGDAEANQPDAAVRVDGVHPDRVGGTEVGAEPVVAPEIAAGIVDAGVHCLGR